MTTTDLATRILRFEVPVNDQFHLIRVPLGSILHVGCRNARYVEFWVREHPDGNQVRAFRVYGTGQPIPCNAHHEGTAVVPGGQLVWHLVSADTVSPTEVA